MSDFEFEDLETKRPLWKNIGYFLGFTLFLYGIVHISLNSSAYTEIASFKYGQLKASVLEVSSDLTLFEPAEVVVEEKLEKVTNNIQSGLQNGVVVHPISHSPGNFGNFFLTGHSSYYAWDKGRFKDVFALLHEVKVGDQIEVYWEGKKYVYKIKAEEVVPPTAVEVLNQPKDKFLITLMTCTPVGTNKNRLILTGELKSQE